MSQRPIPGHVACPQDQDLRERVVTSYAAGRAVLEDPVCVARPSQADGLIERYGPPGITARPALFAALFEQLLFSDDATHRRLRMVLDGPLARYSVRLEPFIERTAGRLLEVALRRRVIDLEHAFAAPLAFRTMAQLMGWSAPVRVRAMAEWATSVINATTGHKMGQSLRTMHEMAGAFQALIAGRQECPGDDLASAIATSPDLRDDTERVLLLLAVFTAGTTTIVTALVNGLPLLLADPERLAVLRAELREGRASLTRVVEELVRVVTPTRFVRRWTTEEVALEGRLLPAGCPIRIEVAEMNRDPEWFPTPGVLDWHRPRNPTQAAFGYGVHACAGRPLALLELRIALSALLSLPGLHLESQETRRNDALTPNQPRLGQVLLSISTESQCEEPGNATTR